VIDDALGDEVRVTVIAAGFEGGQPPRRQPGVSRAADLRPHPASKPDTPEQSQSPSRVASQTTTRSTTHVTAETPLPVLTQRPCHSLDPVTGTRVPSYEDELDIPDFLK
jgi:cell division protein FtsZ